MANEENTGTVALFIPGALFAHGHNSHIAESHSTTNETLSAYNSSFGCFIRVRFSTLKEHEPVG